MQKNVRAGFTLIEVTISIAVFMIIMTAFSGIFVTIQSGWRRQTTDADLVGDLRWGFSYMSQEIRQAFNLAVINQSTISFGLDTNSDGNPDTTIWYWRGDSSSDTTGFGDRTILYRGVGNTINAAYSERQPLTRFVSNNPTGNNIFIFSGNVLTVELTVNNRNRSYSLRSMARPRNV